MKQQLLLLVFLSFTVLNSYCQIEKTFSKLTWINIDSVNSLGSFGYDPSTFTLINKYCELLTTNDICYDKTNENRYILVGRYKNKSMTDEINILYTDGPSFDPEFLITDFKNKIIWSCPGAASMCINENAIIYTQASFNKMFSVKEKFIYSKGVVKEVKQPYYYVGLKEKTLKPIILYSKKEGGEVVASLPADYEVEVLLADNKEYNCQYYLVRTEFGLIGWLKVKTDEMIPPTAVINGLFYYGD